MMPWWVWIAAGVLLLGAELFFIDAQFFLVFIGVSALVTGGLAYVGLSEPAWLPYIVFAALSLISMFTFRKQLYKKLRGSAPGFDGSVTGNTLVLPEAITPGGECRAEVRGTTWTVRNVGSETLAAGESAVIEKIDGLVLHVRRN